MTTALPTEVRQCAEESFASGLYCAESVVLSIARSQGIESDLLPKLATGFCSGMARTCGTCGALSGAILDPPGVEAALKSITGVVDHGLFLGLAQSALIGTDEGVVVVERPAIPPL